MPETDEERKVRQRGEVRDYERANGIVRGTAQHGGDNRGPAGGQDWEGRARMAEARAASGSPLDALDRQAIERTRCTESACELSRDHDGPHATAVAS